MKSNVLKNKILFVVACALRSAALLCATGSLMQTFLSVLGFSASEIYIHSSVLQAANVLTILLGARFADRSSPIRRAAFTGLLTGVFFFAYLPLCIARSTGMGAFALLLAVSIAQAVFVALHTVCDYKVPYFIFKIEEYGGVTALSGIVIAGVTFAVGALVTALSTRFDYIALMLFGFCIAGLLMLASGVLEARLRSLIDMEAVQEDGKDEKKHVRLLDVFRHPAFSSLLLAHLFRGFTGGVITVLATVAFELGFNETVTSAMVSVSSVAMLTACTLYGLSARHIHPRFVIFVGCLLTLLLPTVFIIKNPILFLAVYAAIFFGRTLVDYAVPTAMVYVVPVEIAGPYNAWRMVLNNGGMLLSTAVAVFIPTAALIWVAAALSLAAGLFYLLARVMRKSSLRVSEQI